MFEKRLLEARRDGGALGLCGAWLNGIADLIATAFVERWESVGPGSRRVTGPTGTPRDRRMGGAEHVYRFMKELRFALRGLARTGGFALIVIATIGVAVGASTAIFSVINGVLLTPLQLENPDQLVTIWLQDQNNPQSPLTVPDLRELQVLSSAFEGVEARWTNTASLVGEGEPELTRVAWVTEGYFDVLRVEPFLGRRLQPDELDAVVMSNAIWRRRFGSDPEILGRRVDLGNRTFTVVGVLSPDVNPEMPSIGTLREQNDFWRLMPDEWFGGDDDWVLAWLRVVGRMKPAVSVEDAQADVDRVAEELRSTVDARADSDFGYAVTPVHDELVADVRPVLLVLMGAVTFVLLIACSNVAHLLLVRGEVRATEFAVRSALGAGRRTLVRQLLLETGVLTLAGGALGVGLAYLGVDSILALRPANLPRLDMISVSETVLAFALGASAFSAVLFGLLPALRSTQGNLALSLATRGGSLDRKRQRVGKALVVAEVSLSVILLVGTGLLLRSFAELRTVHPGYDAEGLLTFTVSPPGGFSGHEEALVFHQGLEDELRAVPRVASVGFINRMPLAGGIFSGPYTADPGAVERTNKKEASFRFVTPDLFAAMGTRLLAGRGFSPADGAEAILVDERMAETVWPGQDPVGKRLWTGALGRDGEWSHVIGVVEHMRHRSVEQDDDPTVFFWWGTGGVHRLWVAVRTDGDPEALITPVREAIRAYSSNTTISDVRTMEGRIADALAPNRLALLVIGIFGAVAILLAGIGLYGVVAYSVRRRTREIGIRKALGARGGVILGQVLTEGLVLIGLGALIGLLGSVAVTRLLGGLLYGVRPTDPWTMVGVLALMVSVGTVGALVPARRALGVDPAVTLREE